MRRLRLPLLLALAAAAGLFLQAAGSGARPADDRPLPRPGAQDTIDFLINQRSLGSAGAPVTVIEMSDFQCPFCREHALDVFPELDRLYVRTGKVRWIFINFPLTELHPNATAAAEFAMCAARAGKFWPVHDLIFRNQSRWAGLPDPGPYLLGLADSAGLPRRDIVPCLDRGQMRELVRLDAQAAARAGARSTPSFYIEGGLLRGRVPAEIFGPILDSIYQVKVLGK